MILVPSRGFLPLQGRRHSPVPVVTPTLKLPKHSYSQTKLYLTLPSLSLMSPPQNQGAWLGTLYLLPRSTRTTPILVISVCRSASSLRHGSPLHRYVDCWCQTFARVACLPAVLRLSTPIYIMLLSCYARMSCQVPSVLLTAEAGTSLIIPTLQTFS